MQIRNPRSWLGRRRGWSILLLLALVFLYGCSSGKSSSDEDKDPGEIVEQLPDADHDGIDDSKDQCPGTPAGESVDADGCSQSQLDDDNDGVPNSDDQCPNTPAGESVDATGCSQSQLDDDNDGVPNSEDQCPGTPAGEAVNVDGCSAGQLDPGNDPGDGGAPGDDDTPGDGGNPGDDGPGDGDTPGNDGPGDGGGPGDEEDPPGNGTIKDSDNDGVNDADDQCPGTPAGESVDANGCSASQLDDDNDGVPNSRDLCPNTPAGEAVDETGCSYSQQDDDGDGVPNGIDQCPDTPAGVEVGEDGCSDAERDSDGDGVPDVSDAFPFDPTRSELPFVRIDSPATLTTVGHTPISVQGEVDPSAAALSVNGVAVDYSGGQFTAQVSLEEGHNVIVARMVDVDGIVSTASVSISLDLTPPYVTVESHTDGQTVYSDKVTVTGLINDIVRGTIEAEQATVTVNGMDAEIVNRSYRVSDVELVEGENLIQVVGVDQVGNAATEEFTLHYKKLSGRKLELVSGDSQSARIGEEVDKPLVMRVLDDDGEPVTDSNVVFRVVQGSGIVGLGSEREGRGYVVQTDADGIAQTRFRLGQRAGTGNHKVRARVVGYEDEALFTASAQANIGNKLSVNSGNNQRGGLHQPLPSPFVVAVTDSGANTVKGARVHFEVIQGGGSFQDGSTETTVITDSDGRASAHFVLGGLKGLDRQRVKATLLDAPVVDGVMQNISAGFMASGLETRDPGLTTITGVVLDNQGTALPGVTVRVKGTTRTAIADRQGQFAITEAPVGPVHLIADGSTTTMEGEYPELGYDMVTVSGAENPLAAPIYMVRLNTESAGWVDSKTDAVLTLPEAPGFKLEVPAGSVTFPDGSKEGRISVTVVNSSKVPMAPPNGMQPQFIVTVQPAGAMFEPPARLTLPNVDGHAPGAQVEMFSFDHDLEEFVAIGLGTVSEDSTIITSNPGVGVVKAGWHCGAQPGGSGTPHNCSHCYDCNGTDCTLVPDRVAEEQVPGNCQKELCRGSRLDNSDKPQEEDIPNDCKTRDCVNGSPQDVPDDSDISAEDAKCNMCSDMQLVPDEGKNGNKCGDGSEEQSCLECKDGACQVPDCEAKKGKRTTTLGDSTLQSLTNQIGEKISVSPFVNVDIGGLRYEGWYEEGEECCKDCSKPATAVPYSKAGAGVSGSGYIVAVVPGFGLAQKLPERTYLGYVTVSGTLEFGLGGRASFNVSGSLEKHESICEDGNCSEASVGASGSFFAGLLGLAELKVESCNPFAGKSCSNLLAVGGSINGGAQLEAKATAKAFLGDDCDKSSCIDYSIGAIDLVGNVSGHVEIGLIKRSYSASLDGYRLSEPRFMNEC